MEDKEELAQSLQQEQSKEERIEEQLDETNKLEDKVVIHMVEDHKPQNEIEVKVKVDSKSKGGEKVKESEMESSSSSKQSCKKNPRAKVTIPKPFSLATDQRMSRERRVPMDVTGGSKPVLTKSASFNYKNMVRTTLAVKRTPDLRLAKSTMTSTITTSTGLKPRVITNDQQGNEKQENSSKAKGTMQEKEVKKPHVITAKKQQEGNKFGSDKLQKSLSYKALPLPSFYHQKDPSPKQDINKKLGANSKPTLAGKKSKTVARSEISKSSNEEKGKRLSRIISSGAKGNLTKLVRSTTNSPKDMAISVVSTA